MTLKIHATSLIYTLLAAALLAGCASNGGRAPILDTKTAEKNAAAQKSGMIREAESHGVDWRPQTYTVQKGDTLYGIAFNYGLDYRELAELNGIQNPDLIKVGQEIRLFPSAAAASGKSALVQSVPPEGKPTVAEIKPSGIPVKDQPQAVKLPYSEAAVAQIAKMYQEAPKSIPAAPSKTASMPQPIAESEPSSVPTINGYVAQASVPQPVVASGSGESSDDEIAWAMPATGKVIAEFSESENRKGIDLAGKLGQPVLASASGRVVYSGSGLRGYGKLIIIKHNQSYLSAYAHNDQLLVKEGQTVSQGQQIAQMGNTDADRVELHFEIRKLGKPVDPAKYLPLAKS